MRLLYIMKFFVWESVLEYQEGKPHFLTTIALTGIDKSTLTICFRTKNFIGKDFLNSIDHLTDFDPETGKETDRIKNRKRYKPLVNLTEGFNDLKDAYSAKAELLGLCKVSVNLEVSAYQLN